MCNVTACINRIRFEGHKMAHAPELTHEEERIQKDLSISYELALRTGQEHQNRLWPEFGKGLIALSKLEKYQQNPDLIKKFQIVPIMGSANPKPITLEKAAQNLNVTKKLHDFVASISTENSQRPNRRQN